MLRRRAALALMAARVGHLVSNVGCVADDFREDKHACRHDPGVLVQLGRLLGPRKPLDHRAKVASRADEQNGIRNDGRGANRGVDSGVELREEAVRDSGPNDQHEKQVNVQVRLPPSPVQHRRHVHVGESARDRERDVHNVNHVRVLDHREENGQSGRENNNSNGAPQEGAPGEGLELVGLGSSGGSRMGAGRACLDSRCR